MSLQHNASHIIPLSYKKTRFDHQIITKDKVYKDSEVITQTNES
jgi:hypothetical protein